MSLAIPGAAGPVSDASGFEADDGNLAVNSTFDWNGFAPTVWEGTAPYRTSNKTVDGWAFTGIEDAQATTTDTAFAGGVKQDNNCPVVNTGKAPNKDDLERIYVSSNTVDGDIFLNLAWVRIPQNTTSPSAHIGFEFNQGEDPCATGGLVNRTAGDLLIVYDFAGSSTDTPTITMRRWVESGPCEVGNSSAPCWGTAQNLTALGFAEAKVNTSDVGPVQDAIGPGGTETLGLNEFGEAGINLTDAGVFGTDECVAFGSAFGVSRSSGNSGTAQMKDLVGPGEINITNCGRVIIRKETIPDPDPTDTTFDYTTTGGLDPDTFSLKNGEARDYGGEVFAGQYSVTEADPGPTFALKEVDCSASDDSHGTVIQVNGATVSFDLKPLDVVDCTYVNELQTGAIEITKDRKHAASGSGDHPHAGVEFTIEGDGVSETVTTDANGEACLDGLDFGDYTVTETTPTGYAPNDPEDVTVSAVADCDGGGTPATVSFHNTPLTNITVSVDSQVDGGTASVMQCTDSDGNIYNGSTGANGDGSLTVNDLLPTDPTVTLTCTVIVDP
ncbi:MAG TPA: SpaA isopeptide-forming pilin-related protein [Jiangellaceae bacterium]